MRQVTLAGRRFPTTRFQGSKRKLAPAIVRATRHLDHDTVLDAFGGTGAVSYAFKAAGKRVTFNDALRANQIIGRALIENSRAALPLDAARELAEPAPGRRYGDVVARCFAGLFFTPAENRWIDVTGQNILAMTDRYRQALAFFGLFQACLAKRPYNLFHRANLSMRERHVRRTFGNKTTWETPFLEHFLGFVEEANRAVFANGRRNAATCHDALAYPRRDFDLVYIDTPYMNRRGVGLDYLDFYHFLEGLSDYGAWESRLEPARKHRPLRHARPVWCDRRQLLAAFEALVDRFASSHLVISYRSDGLPSPEELRALLRRRGRQVKTVTLGTYQYALSTNASSRELLFISERPGRAR